MKLLGTITEIIDDKEITLYRFPEGLVSIKSAAIVKIGFSLNLSNDYVITDFSFKRNKLTIDIKSERPIPSKINKEMGIWIDENELIFESESGYLIGDLVNCIVVDANDGKLIGKIKEIYNLPANDVWIVDTPTGELPVPAVSEFIIDVNLKDKIVKINVIDGLMDLIQ